MRQLVMSIVLALLLVSSGLLLVLGTTEAAERNRPIRIGVLTESWGPTPATVGLRDGLLELGYQENEDFVIGVRFTQGDVTALPEAALDLAQYGVDLIFASRAIAAQAAQGATAQIPIVFIEEMNPVKLGLVESFARPGRNLTGVTDLGHELSPKRLEVFREMIPGLKRVLFLYDANHIYSVVEAQKYRDAAHRLGIVLVEHAVQTTEEAQAILAQVRQDKVDGILKPFSASLNIPGLILETAAQRGFPTMSDAAFWVERGGLVSYGPDYYASGKQAARLVDKILQGANPAEIPVEVNSTIEFAINLKTAKTLGLTIPPEVLFQANKIVR